MAKDEFELLSEFGEELRDRLNHAESMETLKRKLLENIEGANKLQAIIRNTEQKAVKDGKIEIYLEEFHQSIIQLSIQIQEAKIWADRFMDIAYLTPEAEGIAFESGKETIDHSHEEGVIVEGVGLYKTYRPTMSTVYALRGANLKIRKGEFLAILGSSGEGKTTLMNILTGLDQPDKGKVFFEGKDISKMSDNALADFRRKNIGVIFQQYVLDPRLTVFENVALPAMMTNNTDNLHSNVINMLESVGIAEFANQFPTKLSGGQMQRVIIARACINNPLIVFADEPTGDLDSETGKQVMKNFRRLCDEKRIAFVVVTHDVEMTEFADRTINMARGKITEDNNNSIIQPTTPIRRVKGSSSESIENSN